MVRRWMLPALLGSVSGCAALPPPPPAHLSRKMAVLPVANRTGEALAVAGVGPLDRYVLRSEVITVADILRSEARLELETNGFQISSLQSTDAALKERVPTDASSAAELAAQAGLGSPCLYMEIRRWEADAPMHPKHVLVGVAASLIDPATRQVTWHTERRPYPVATPGVITMEAAYVVAARKVVEEMLSTLRPDPAAPR